MRIGIIGVGQIGGNLAHRFTALGHEVTIANSRGPETLAALAKETSAKAATVEQAARAGDVVIVAIPLKAIPSLAGLFDAVPDHVVVIDTSNYYPKQRDGRIDPIENGMTASRWVSNQLGRPVVKAFNTVYASNLLKRGKPKGASGRLAVPVAGDDRRAKDVVIKLLDELGFDGVDAGSLDESWRQQPATPVFGADLDVEGLRRGLAAAKPERTPEFRAEASPAGAGRR
jgi:8-hydroxy-5-deazaflavin:NADPH oxidoreductase